MSIAKAVAASGDCKPTELGLRFDRVAVRMLDRLARIAQARAPDGASVVLTLAAPIRTPARVTAALEHDAEALIADDDRRVRTVEVGRSRASLCLIRHAWKDAPSLLGFVHNADVDPARLVALATEWLRRTLHPDVF